MNFARYCQFLFHGFIPFCTLVPVLYENAYFFQPCSKRLNCQIFVTWHWVVSIVLICISFIMRKIKLLFVGVKSHFFGELILYLLSAAAAKSLQSCPTLCDPKDGSPPRLLCPWDSPGKNTGVGCHFLLQCTKVKSQSEVTQSCPTLSDPMDCSLPGSSIHGIFQARVLEWGAIPLQKWQLLFSGLSFFVFSYEVLYF